MEEVGQTGRAASQQAEHTILTPGRTAAGRVQQHTAVHLLHLPVSDTPPRIPFPSLCQPHCAMCMCSIHFAADNTAKALCSCSPSHDPFTSMLPCGSLVATYTSSLKVDPTGAHGKKCRLGMLRNTDSTCGCGGVDFLGRGGGRKGAGERGWCACSIWGCSNATVSAAQLCSCLWCPLQCCCSHLVQCVLHTGAVHP